jgi:eukaryotic-like serine/threonine-protein kinase
MTPEEWKKVTALFHAVKEMPLSAREAYLSTAHPDEPQLRQEVERLLEASEESGGFLPPLPPFPSTASPGTVAVPGEQILHYQLMEKIGEGGMGEVYKARDLTLDRIVALKFLSPRLQIQEESKLRFLQEAKTASALDHPNICTIHGIEQTQRGQMFIVMAFYDGETIREKTRRAALPQAEAIKLALQIGSGLMKAHSVGIVHRDIKPANVIVTRDGLAKILDFGIAKFWGTEGLTQRGVSVGTIGYMSPEQALGEPTDHRTDIWALGIMLYEMLTARPPFPGNHFTTVLTSILHEEPEPSNAPPELEKVIRRSLARDLEKRYQSMKEMIEDLEAFHDRSVRDNVKAEGREIVPTLAVLPFVSLSSNPETDYFSSGLTDELISTLSRIDWLRVVSRTTIFQFKGQPIDVRELGRKLNVATVLEGSVREFQNKVRVSVQLVDAADGYQLWSETYNRRLDDVFAVQDEIAQNVVTTLAPLLRGAQKDPIKQDTASPEAYRLYLKGRHHCRHWTPQNLEHGLRYLKQALELDPHFAKAQSAVAVAELLKGSWGLVPASEAWARVKSAAEAALAIDSNLAEPRACLAAVLVANDWNWEEAQREFNVAISLGPVDALLRDWYCGFFLVPQGLVKEAIAIAHQRLDLDPLSPPVNASLGWFYFLDRQLEQATAQARTAIELSPQDLEPYWTLGLSNLGLDRVPEAIQSFEGARWLVPDNTFTLSLLTTGYAAAGRFREAADLLDGLEQRSRQHYVAPTHLAWASIALKRIDRAFEWLDSACQIRDVMLLYLKVLPLYDPIRADPRYRQVLERVKLPPD